MAALYSYIGLFSQTVTLADTNINFRGAWSETTSYAVLDAAIYNDRWFICVTAHTGVTPPSVYEISTPTYWSPLVLVEGDPQTLDTASEIAANAAYAQSQLAIQTAWNGTNTANEAYALAVTGTDAAAAAQATADAVAAVVNYGIPGTVSVWAASVFNGTNDTQLVFVNGILAATA